MGRVDTVIANAGIGFGAPSFMELKIETFRKVMNVNVEGAFFTLREAARHMVAREGGGSMVGVASLAAIEGAARNQAYGASKGALISMIKGICGRACPLWRAGQCDFTGLDCHRHDRGFAGLTEI